jgi:proline-rich tail region repeat protein
VAVPTALVGTSGTAVETTADTLADARAGTKPTAPRPPRTDGIVVPLRVPLLVRLRAAFGLLTLVTLLGIATAAIIVALVVAGMGVLESV